MRYLAADLGNKKVVQSQLFKQNISVCHKAELLNATMYNNIVKKKAVTAGIKYLKNKQLKGEKGRKIDYNNLELQDYLNPCSNMNLEDQRLVFSLRCEMNP